MSYPREKNKKYLKNRYANQRRDFINFLGGKCQCGETENLQFDHIDPSTKSFIIGRLWPTKKLPLVYEELKKCQLLCEECHRTKSGKETSERRKDEAFSHGTFYGWMKKKCKCGECIKHKHSYYDFRNRNRRKNKEKGYKVKR